VETPIVAAFPLACAGLLAAPGSHQENGIARSGELIGIAAMLPEQHLGTKSFEVHRGPDRAQDMAASVPSVDRSSDPRGLRIRTRGWIMRDRFPAPSST
jgi:hypothetical protein